MSWSVEFESDEVKQEVAALIASGKLTKEDQIIIRKWTEQVEAHGPESLTEFGQWDDHTLDFEWEGYRSSAFSNRGRIIYRIENKKVIVSVARITPNHNYKGKKR